MKKTNLIVGIIATGIFVACKKDYICTCTTNGIRDTKKIEDVSRRAAETNCMSFKQTSSNGTKDTVIQRTCVLSN